MHKVANYIRIAGVIGDPINHTRSPLIHNYWIKKNNINCFYIPLKVKSSDLEKKLKFIKELEFCGLNVTIPHKENIMCLVDDIKESAKVIGAANTIYFEDGKIIADNSDTYGFYQSMLKNFPKYNFKKEKVLIFGSGGAARAVTSVFIKENVSEIGIINRNREKAERVKKDLSSRIKVYDWYDYSNALIDVSTVVNTTSLGNLGSEKFSIDLKGVRENGIAIDLVYNPLKTSFMKKAEKENLKAINGLDMLIYQAKKGFQKWFKKTPTYTPELRKLIENSLKS
ncbi:MAG: shikimate dehydrogenase [Paracoccaceae bacterium]